MTRADHLSRAGAVGLCLALAAPLAMPAVAQEATAPGAEAAARLDFPAALEELSAAIEADPAAAAPRLARAELHLKMQRPALALADLGAVLAADPAHLPALRARVAIWNSQSAWNRAREDLDAALVAAPDDPDILALRAEVNRSAGMTDAALADYEAALAARPGDADLTRARDALAGSTAPAADSRNTETPVAPASAAPAPTEPATIAPGVMMSDAFVVTEGDPAAPDTLHIVHAATGLAEELDAVDTAVISRAVDAGALRVVHLFTYTGSEASIWGNLALICAGEDGFAATLAALSDTTGQAALEAAGTGDFAPLERLLSAAYSVAGIDAGLVGSCALDRLHATRYLADWQSSRATGARNGNTLLETWPAWVLNGSRLDPTALTERLAALAPEEAPTSDVASEIGSEAAPEAPLDATPTPEAAATEPDALAETKAPESPEPEATVPPVTAVTDDPSVATDAPEVAETAPTPPPPAEAAPEAPDIPQPDAPQQVETASVPDTPAAPPTNDEQTATAPGPVRFPDRPLPAGDARVPVELRGIYAPSLAACLGYLDSIEDPSRIDAVLPALNPLDDAGLGTILVTSRRAYLFNPLDTECAITSAGADGPGWQGSFNCASPLAPEASPTLALGPAPADGTAPRVTAAFGGADPVVMRQCRALGQLGNAFAPLWTADTAACSVSAPVEQGQFAFSLDTDGNLVLRMVPSEVPTGADRARLHAVIDGEAIGDTPGDWDGTAWRMSLGPFDAAAESLGWGMFLDIRTSGTPFEARLPLFGSSAAMDKLAACAPASE